MSLVINSFRFFSGLTVRNAKWQQDGLEGRSKARKTNYWGKVTDLVQKMAWEWKKASYKEYEIEEMMDSLAKGRSLDWEWVWKDGFCFKMLGLAPSSVVFRPAASPSWRPGGLLGMQAPPNQGPQGVRVSLKFEKHLSRQFFSWNFLLSEK